MINSSKDNFWNFVFWFGMSAGFILDDIIGTPKLGLISNLIRLATLLFMSTLLIIFNKTRFVKEHTFVNSEGRELKVPKDLPPGFFVIVSTIALTVLAGLLLDKYKGSDLIASFVIFPLLFGIPTLFFIFKNCPISILCNRKVWSVMANVNGSANNFDHFHSATSQTTSIRSFSYDDSSRRFSSGYSHLLGNIHHRSRH